MDTTHLLDQAEAELHEAIMADQVTERLRDALDGNADLSTLHNGELETLLMYAKVGRWYYFTTRQEATR